MRNVSQASTTDLPTIPASGVAELGEDGLDPELVLLHQPPALRRHLTLGLMALVAAAAIMLVITLRRDVAYFFSRPEVQDLGEASGLDPSTLVPNTFVRVAGTPMASETVHFGRVLLGGDLNTNTYNLSNRRTTARDAVLKLATHGIRGSVARYMVPQKHRGERRVFDAMDAASLDWATFNDLSASTLTYDLQDPELIEKTLAFLPKPVWHVLERLLASTRFAPLRLDWFAGRGLVAQDAGVIALDAVDSPRDRLSDHQPIHVEVVLS